MLNGRGPDKHDARRPVRALAVVACVITLVGCQSARRGPETSVVRGHNTPAVTRSAPSIPLPAAALLAALPEPDCRPKPTASDERERLDYERQCYRHAEIIARSRLDELQSALAKSVRPANHEGRGSP